MVNNQAISKVRKGNNKSIKQYQRFAIQDRGFQMNLNAKDKISQKSQKKVQEFHKSLYTFFKFCQAMMPS
jgi:hypothetical protein